VGCPAPREVGPRFAHHFGEPQIRISKSDTPQGEDIMGCKTLAGGCARTLFATAGKNPAFLSLASKTSCEDCPLWASLSPGARLSALTRNARDFSE